MRGLLHALFQQVQIHRLGDQRAHRFGRVLLRFQPRHLSWRQKHRHPLRLLLFRCSHRVPRTGYCAPCHSEPPQRRSRSRIACHSEPPKRAGEAGAAKDGEESPAENRGREGARARRRPIRVSSRGSFTVLRSSALPKKLWRFRMTVHRLHRPPLFGGSG